MGDYLTVQDIASKLEVTADTVRRWLRMGTLKGTSLGRAGYRIKEKDFYIFMDHRCNNPQSSSPQSNLDHLAKKEPGKQQRLPASIEYADLIELAHDAIIVRDPMSAILLWNQGAEHLYGWTLQEAAGKMTHTLLHTRFPLSREDADTQLIQYGRWEGKLQHTCQDGRQVTVDSRQVLIRDEQGHPTAIIEINRDVSVYQRAEDFSHFLSEASHILNTSLDYEETLKKVASLAVPILADFCSFDILLPDNTIRRVAWENVEPPHENFFERMARFVPTLEMTNHPVSQVLKTSRPFIVATVDEAWMQQVALSPEHLQLMRDLHLCSLMIIPLIMHGTTLGSLTLCATAISGSHYTANDVELASDLADRAALAIGNALLFTEQVQARQRAEALTQELQATQIRFELAQYAGKIGTFEWDISTNAILWTPELEALYGLTAGAFEGTYENWARKNHPVELTRVEEKVQEAVETGATFNAEIPSALARWHTSLAHGKGRGGLRRSAYTATHDRDQYRYHRP